LAADVSPGEEPYTCAIAPGRHQNALYALADTPAPAPLPPQAKDLPAEQRAAVVAIMDTLLQASSIGVFDIDQLMEAVEAAGVPVGRGAARRFILHLMHMDPRARAAAGLPQMCWYGDDYINKV
jgi:hypothetical protein